MAMAVSFEGPENEKFYADSKQSPAAQNVNDALVIFFKNKRCTRIAFFGRRLDIIVFHRD